MPKATPTSKTVTADDVIERLHFVQHQGGGYSELAQDCIALIERMRPMAGSWESYEAAQERKAEMRLVHETAAVPVRSNWNTSRVCNGWDCWTCGAFVTHRQDATEIERDCLKCGPNAQKATQLQCDCPPDCQGPDNSSGICRAENGFGDQT